MTIHLPHDIESSIQAAVHSGHFASVDDAMTEAARLLLRSLKQRPQAATPISRDTQPDPLLGSMRDAADELDEIVAEAMKQRRASPPAARQEPSAPRHKPIWDVIEEENRSIPPEVWDALPADLAEQHDHYIYGTPKRPPSP